MQERTETQQAPGRDFIPEVSGYDAVFVDSYFVAYQDISTQNCA